MEHESQARTFLRHNGLFVVTLAAWRGIVHLRPDVGYHICHVDADKDESGNWYVAVGESAYMQVGRESYV